MTEVAFERVHPDAQIPVRATSGSAGFDAFAYLSGRTLKVMRQKPRPRWQQVAERFFGAMPARPADTLVEERYDESQGLTLARGEWALIPLGVKIGFPAHLHCDIRPRSGLALKHGITLLNGLGLGDSDYAEEYGAILVNHGSAPFTLRHGERIAQLSFVHTAEVQVVERSVTRSTERDGGFGHTGR